MSKVEDTCFIKISHFSWRKFVKTQTSRFQVPNNSPAPPSWMVNNSRVCSLRPFSFWSLPRLSACLVPHLLSRVHYSFCQISSPLLSQGLEACSSNKSWNLCFLDEVFNSFIFLRNMFSNEFILTPGAAVQVSICTLKRLLNYLLFCLTFLIFFRTLRRPATCWWRMTLCRSLSRRSWWQTEDRKHSASSQTS